MAGKLIDISISRFGQKFSLHGNTIKYPTQKVTTADTTMIWAAAASVAASNLSICTYKVLPLLALVLDPQTHLHYIPILVLQKG